MWISLKFSSDCNSLTSPQIGPYGGYLSLLSTLVQLELTKRTCDSEKFREIVKLCIATVERCINIMVSSFGLKREGPSVILSNLSHKVLQLFGVLRKMFADPEHENDQCLIFVKERSTAKVLYHALKAYAALDKSFPIKPDFMVGINAGLSESIEAVLCQSYHSITLQKFCDKETNCIVSTNVLEEGVDLQMCNLVIAFEDPKTYRSYVQARGRARVDNSNYIVLIGEQDKQKFMQKVTKWQAIDRELKKQLLFKTINRPAPTQEDIEREQDQAWEPFKTPKGAILNNLNSVR